MRKEKALIALLRRIVELLAEESVRNPEFAARLESALSELPERKVSARKAAARKAATAPRLEPGLDIHSEWNIRGETDFRVWLRHQSVPALRAIIRSEDFDPTRRTAKWKEAEKLAEFIADGLRARLSRGSAFIGRGTSE